MAEVLARPASTDATVQPTAPRVWYFDYLRTWATFGVVLLHSGAGITGDVGSKRADFVSRYSVGAVYDSIGRFGVGCFFMISGALLLDPAHRFRLGRQIRRILIPLLVWSAVIVGVNYLLARSGDQTIHGYVAYGHSFADVIKAVVHQPAAYHLWFVYVLAGIYLVVPLLRPLTALPAKRRGELLRYALVVWFVFAAAYPVARKVWTDLPQLYPGSLPETPSSYLGFILLGFYLHHHGVTVRKRQVPAAIYAAVAVVAAVTIFLLSWHAHNSTPHQDNWGNDNLTPQIILYASCVFLFAKTAFNRPGRCYPFVALFSRLSFRIYLMHVLLLHYLRKFSAISHWYYHSPLVAVVVVMLLTVSVSFLVAWAIDLIKPIRKYV